MDRVVVAPDRNRLRFVDRGWVASLRRTLSQRGIALCLLGLVALSTALRIAFVVRVHAPTVFSDELGYDKLAQSIAQNGKLALFNKEGISYSPLYPALLSPIYALGASAPAAYDWIKIVNSFLISLSILPIYKIARFVSPRRPSLLVAALSTLAPLTSYAAFTMSENVAYPLCLVAIWMMLKAICEPRARNDAILLGAIIAASAARVQLIVLVPAALTSFLLTGIFERHVGESSVRSAVNRVVRHRLLFGSVAAVLVVAGVGALSGKEVSSVFGRYAAVGRAGYPNLWHFLNLTVRHVAGLDLALGVAPFAGTLVATLAFVRSGSRGKTLAFAAAAASLTGWLVLEVAWDAAQFDSPHGDVPRIHERFLIYVVPLFLVALLATVRIAARVSRRSYLVAAVCAALLPVVIPFHTVVNSTVSVDSFGLEPFARIIRGATVPAPHATLTAIWISATFALLYVVVRERLRSVVTLVLIAFLLISGLTWTRIESGALFARGALPAHRDWVDRAKPDGGVVLVTAGEFPASALETAYNNLSIARLYYICAPNFGPDFGETQVMIDRAGRLRDSAGLVRARYAVMPAGLGVRGQIVASNPQGKEVLVAPRNGVLTVPPGTPVRCHRPGA
jgi:hypothetical protein